MDELLHKRGAIERAREDVEAGRHWLARQRLGSYLTTTGYDPDVLALAGRISNEMHDEYDAGRMWLLSNATGPEVDQAIETFMTHVGKHANHIASQLPRSVRLSAIEQYPDIVRSRIDHHGLRDSIAWQPCQRGEWQGLPWYLVVVGIIVLLVLIVVVVVGVLSVGDWLFD